MDDDDKKMPLKKAGLNPKDTHKGDMMKGQGAAYHTYSLEERRVFCKHINALLKEDPDLSSDLPMDPSTDDLFGVASKGVLLW